MFDREKFTPEFYDKMSESEKKEFVQSILEDQLTECIKRGGGKMTLSTEYGGIPTWEELDDIIFSDKEYPEADNILKYIEDPLITDNHERRLHDPSIYRYRGRQVFHTSTAFDYPVMYPEDVKTMKGVSDELMERFKEYIIVTGAVQNFKQELGYRRLQFVEDIIHGQIKSLSEELMGNMPTRKYLIPPRSRRSMKDNQLTLMVLLSMLKIDMSAKLDLDSVIHMRWPKPKLVNLKAHDFRYGKMWEDNPLINYATGEISPIDRIILDSLSTFGPDINSEYGMSTPNLNEFDKKKLERIIKRRKRNDKPRKRR